jgi:hypothetical protein
LVIGLQSNFVSRLKPSPGVVGSDKRGGSEITFYWVLQCVLDVFLASELTRGASHQPFQAALLDPPRHQPSSPPRWLLPLLTTLTSSLQCTTSYYQIPYRPIAWIPPPPPFSNLLCPPAPLRRPSTSTYLPQSIRDLRPIGLTPSPWVLVRPRTTLSPNFRQRLPRPLSRLSLLLHQPRPQSPPRGSVLQRWPPSRYARIPFA